MIDDDLYRMIVRARTRWRRTEPACSNEAAAEAEGRPLFGNLSENPGVNGYNPFVQFEDSSKAPAPGENYQG